MFFRCIILLETKLLYHNIVPQVKMNPESKYYVKPFLYRIWKLFILLKNSKEINLDEIYTWILKSLTIL